MVEIELTANSLIVHLRGADWLWALRRRLEFPLAHVAGARIDPELAHARPEGLRLGGTYVPGKLTAGTFGWLGGDRVFWAVHNADRAIIVYLDNEPYAGLVLEVADPAREVRRISAAVRQRPLP